MKQWEEVLDYYPKHTLEEVLNFWGLSTGSDVGMVVIDVDNPNTELMVSYRYLNCKSWKDLLKYIVVSVCITDTIFGPEACFYIQKKKGE